MCWQLGPQCVSVEVVEPLRGGRQLSHWGSTLMNRLISVLWNGLGLAGVDQFLREQLATKE